MVFLIILAFLIGALWRRWLGMADAFTWPWYGRARSRVLQVITGVVLAGLISAAAAWSPWGALFGFAAVAWLTAPAEFSVRQIHHLIHRLPLPPLRS